MKKVLYLHGLNSNLQEDRRAVLESFGLNIFAPQINYKENPNALLGGLITKYKNIDFIIGSSAGGLVTYYLSAVLNAPALVFNPALTFAKDYPNLPQEVKRNQLLLMVLGAKDEVINPHETFDFINKNTNFSDFIEIHWRNQMEHSFPIDIFKEEVDYFFKKI